MPLYRFKISDASGKVSETIVEAENQKDAVKRLRARRAVVLSFLGDANDLENAINMYSNVTALTLSILPIV